MSADLERLLTDYNLSTLLLAKKLESLPQRVRENIFNQIETAIEHEEDLRRAIDTGHVASIERMRPLKKT